MADGSDALEIVINPLLSRFIRLPGHSRLLDLVAVRKNGDLLLLPLDTDQTEAILDTFPSVVDLIPPDTYFEPKTIHDQDQRLSDLRKTIEDL